MKPVSRETALPSGTLSSTSSPLSLLCFGQSVQSPAPFNLPWLSHIHTSPTIISASPSLIYRKIKSPIQNSSHSIHPSSFITKTLVLSVQSDQFYRCMRYFSSRWVFLFRKRELAKYANEREHRSLIRLESMSIRLCPTPLVPIVPFVIGNIVYPSPIPRPITMAPTRPLQS